MNPRIDEREFRRVAKIVMPRAWRCLRRFGCRRNECVDAMQTVLLQLAKHWEGIDHADVRGVITFTCCIAVNVAHDVVDRRASQRTVREGFRNWMRGRNGLSPEDNVEGRETADIIDGILAFMPPERREVFVLHEIEGLTAREIADAIAIPAGTVASRLRIARAEFAILFERQTRDDDLEPECAFEARA